MENKQNKSLLVSVSLGGIDRIQSLPENRDFDAIMFTDKNTVLRSDPNSIRSWNSIVTPSYPRQDWHPRLRAKYFKLQIHRLEEVKKYDYLIWIDAGIRILDQGFFGRCIEMLQRMPPWRRLAMFAHPFRVNLRQEYDYIVSEMNSGNQYLIARYSNENMREQLAYYDSQNWDVEGRLLCGGFCVVENSPLMARCFDDWWDHNLRFTIMDQLSLPVVLKKHYIEPFIIDGNLYGNSIIKVGDHDIVI